MRLEIAGIGVVAIALVLSGCASGGGMMVRKPAVCADQTVQVYFDPDSAEVTRESRAVLRQAAAAAKGCEVRKVSVLGLADAAGTPEANMALSEKRAQSVSAALQAAGLPPGEFELAAQGQAGSVTATGQAAPLRRRADITLNLAKPD